MKKKNNQPLNFIERNNTRLSFLVSVVVLILVFFIFYQMDYRMIRKPKESATKAAATLKEKQNEEANTPLITTASVIAVGDNFYQSQVLWSGQTDSDVWNYDHVYANVLDEIQAADIAMVNEEAVFTSNHDSVNGSDPYATPTEVGDALVKAGFNVIQTATNHIDDFGYDYIAQSFNFWKNYPDVTVIGTHETAEDADTIQIREVNDIRIAFLNYTYGTNGDGGGDDRDYLIDIFSKNKVASDIQKAKSMSDCIIVAAHWGNDNDSTPSEYEKQWATFLMQQGVDVIIGSNPHVLQPYGRLTDDQGNSTLVFYSLGNFVSSQTQLVNLLGGMAAFTIQKIVQNGITTVEITDSELRPLVMHYNSDTPVYAVYMLDDYTEDLASTHSIKDWIGDEFTLSNLQSKFDEIMSMNVTPSTSTDLLGENEDSTTYYKY